MNQAKMQNMCGFAAGGPSNLMPNSSDSQNQIMSGIVHSLQQQPPATGWQAQVDIPERVHIVKQMYVYTLTSTLNVQH